MCSSDLASLPEVLSVMHAWLARFSDEDVRRLDAELVRHLVASVRAELSRLEP